MQDNQIAEVQAANERTSLLIRADDSTAPVPSSQIPSLKDLPIVRVLSFGCYGLFTSAQMVLNSKMLTALPDQDASGAIALILPYQAVVIGLSMGPVMALGLEMGPHVGKKDFLNAGVVIKTGWIATAAIGLVGSGLMVLPLPVFPHLFKSNTAEIASRFLAGSAIGNIPFLMITIGSQIAYQEGDWFVPPLAGLTYLLISGASNYALGFRADLGAFGVGMGSSISAIATFSLIQGWLTRMPYEKYGMYRAFPDCDVIRQQVSLLFKSGGILSVQRLSEWFNLMLSTTSIGVYNANQLSATGPAVQYIGLFGSFFQAISMAVGMLIAKNNGALDAAVVVNDASLAMTYNQKNIHILIQAISAVILLSSFISMGSYFLREPMVNVFLNDKSTAIVPVLPEALLVTSMLGFIPDGSRIVSLGAVRAWKKELIGSTLANAAIMVLLAVPMGIGTGLLAEKTSTNIDNNYDKFANWMFYCRAICACLAAVLATWRCYTNIVQDRDKIALPLSQHRNSFLNEAPSISIDEHSNDSNQIQSSLETSNALAN